MPTPLPTNFDVLVVGSGASGGWAAKRLSEAGLKVAIVEAGRPQSDDNFSEHKPAFELKYRNMAPESSSQDASDPIKFDVCNEYTQDWFINDLDEPYTTPADKPFNWMGRLRMTGGRTNVWGRVSLRFSDADFKAASHDGYGEDWPLSYSDIAPYYDLVEKYVGITGMAEGLEHLPDGQFQPPMPLTCQESIFRDRVKQNSIAPSRSPAPPTSRARSTAAAHATTAVLANAAASPTPISIPPSPPSPMRSKPATANSSPTPWSTKSSWTPPAIALAACSMSTASPANPTNSPPES